MVERSEPAGAKHLTSAERKSDREVVVRRIFDAPARLVLKVGRGPSCSGNGGCRSRSA